MPVLEDGGWPGDDTFFLRARIEDFAAVRTNAPNRDSARNVARFMALRIRERSKNINLKP
jgi:hypothetical protein